MECEQLCFIEWCIEGAELAKTLAGASAAAAAAPTMAISRIARTLVFI
jgi:hypothetical protein